MARTARCATAAAAPAVVSAFSFLMVCAWVLRKFFGFDAIRVGFKVQFEISMLYAWVLRLC